MLCGSYGLIANVVRPLHSSNPTGSTIDERAGAVEDSDRCSQRASTPILLRLPDLDAVFGELTVPPLPGRLAEVASRHGRRPIGNSMLGAIFVVCGRFRFGSSPRWSTKTRLGLSANTLCPAPNVHPS